MKIDKFKVCFGKKDVVYFITFCVITLIACIFILFNEQYRAIAIFGILFIICEMMIFISTLLFKMVVENNCFRVRTRLGKKYEFNLSEIEGVFCIKRTGIKVGNYYSIKIYAKNHFFAITSKMDGFETLAEYILQMYINDELYEDTISKYNIQQLKMYTSKKHSIAEI